MSHYFQKRLNSLNVSRHLGSSKDKGGGGRGLALVHSRTSRRWQNFYTLTPFSPKTAKNLDHFLTGNIRFPATPYLQYV